MRVDHINPPESFDPLPRGYSHVVRVENPGTFIYIAGQGPSDQNVGIIGLGDFETQVRVTFQNLKRLLEAAGATFNDVVKMNVYVTDIKAHQWPFRQVRAEFIDNEHPPASTMIEVPRLAVDGLLVEVEVVAARP